MFEVNLQIAIFSKHWFLILLQADIPAPVQDGMKKIVLLVATATKLVSHPIVDVEEVVCVLTGVLHQLRGEGPAGWNIPILNS